MKKKVLAMLLAAAMAVGLVACGSDKKETEGASATKAGTETETEAGTKGVTNQTDDGGTKAAASGEFDGTIKIGCALPLTGSVALNGEMILQGIQMAVDEVNAAGGIDGKEVVIDAQDDQGEPNQAANVANMFVSDEEVVAVIGNLKSSCTLAGAPIYEDAGLVTISPDSSSPSVTDAGEYIFRIKDSDTILASQCAQGAIDDGHTKFAICHENNDYGLGVLQVATETIEKADCEVVAVETILTGEQTDFSTSIANIKASGADAIIMGVDYNESGLFMKQMKDAGLDLPRYATDGLFTQAFIEVGGAACDGTTVLTSFHETDTSEKVQGFIAAFKEYTGKDENPSIFQAEGYDAAKIVLEAIENAGTDRTAIRDYMSTMKYQGVIGDCTFDENGDVNIPLMRCMVKDGKFELID
ncbi:MAG: branched-chain amino acid ABC transporter substrate-binding protein [Lachnospiraceae bacterium]|nr:branched-chain amino acid ABC transporter substrate-binding protein [Lachnospiraceae bacterium]